MEDAEKAFGIDKGVVHIVKNALQLGDGGNDVGKEHHVIHYLTDGHPRILYEDQIGGEDDDQHCSHLLDKTLDAAVVKADLPGFHLIGRYLVLKIQLLAGLDPFPVEGLDDVDGVDNVLDALALALQIAAHFPAPAFEPASLAIGNPEINGDDSQGHQSHIDIGREHQDQCQRRAGEQRQQVDEKILHRPGDAADTLVDTGLNLSGGVFIAGKIGHPEGKDLFDDALRKVSGHENAHPFPVIVLRKGNSGRENFLPQQHGRDEGEDTGGLAPGKIRSDKSVDGIHCPVQNDGVDLLHHGTDERENQCNDYQKPVRLYKRPDVLEKLKKIHLVPELFPANIVKKREIA